MRYCGRATRGVHPRGLCLFERCGLLETQAVADRLQWDHGGGFSRNAGVRIEASDRKGLEWLLRYCARPIFDGGPSEETPFKNSGKLHGARRQWTPFAAAKILL
jgi:hypothetical protein